MAAYLPVYRSTILENFLRYISINTQSDPDSGTFPSSNNQFVLAELLVQELKNLGLEDANVDDNAYVMATLPANTKGKIPAMGFIAHMDTSPDMSGENIRPVIHKHFNGKDLLLNEEKNICMPADDFPELKKYVGQTLITSDGTTLLGADNKAGIAEIMTALQVLSDNPRIPHGTIKVAFTPDEEIGKGAERFDVKRFGADFAYTIDGGALGELQYENFNAAFARVTIQGTSIHPGDAKDKMVNACLLGMELNQMLPEKERPEHTADYEGFFHLTRFRGSVEQAVMEYIIRDHDRQRFEQRKSHMYHITGLMNERHGPGRLQLELKDQYYNMHSNIYPVIHIVELAKQAMEALNIQPRIKPIRGGTDGARLSYMGLPCPNIFTGGHNYHGRFEFIPLESMEKATQVILEMIGLVTQKQQGSDK